MRDLFEMDTKNYDPSCRRFVRPSARGIIIRDGKLAMAYVASERYYKFPGGGIDEGEAPVTALIREVREESGLIVVPETIREYGRVHRVEYHDKFNEIFDQENFYYFCEVETDAVDPEFTESETAAGFQAVYVDPREAAKANREAAERKRLQAVGFDEAYTVAREIEREGRVLELLLEEGFFQA